MSELIDDWIKSKNPSQEEIDTQNERAKKVQKYRIASAVIAGLAFVGYYFDYLTLKYFSTLVVVAAFITLYGIWTQFFQPIIKDKAKTSPGIYRRLKIIVIIGLISVGIMIVFGYLLNKSFS